MYNDFFGFVEKPFSIAPNPRYLYMSRHHEDALAHLIYGIQEGNGFVLLTGEVGTGKTTLCNCLLAKLPDRTDVAYILNPRVTVNELLATVCEEFSIPYPDDSSAPLSNKALIDLINQFLLSSHAEGRHTVLMIDEAQNLSLEVLEQIRLLTNLETHDKKLLQIILIGQPELRDKFSQPQLRQLAQRITARFHLSELSRQEVQAYINHRMTIARQAIKGRYQPSNLLLGARKSLFTPAAEKRIHRLSGGIPRLINLLCDRSLLAAYSQGNNQVTPKLVDSASLEILPSTHTQHVKSKSPILVGSLFTAVIITGLVLFLVKPDLLDNLSPASALASSKQRYTQITSALTSSQSNSQALSTPKQSSAQSASTPRVANQSELNPTNATQTQVEQANAQRLSVQSTSNPKTSPVLLDHLPYPEGLTGEQTRLLAFQTLLQLWGISTPIRVDQNECAIAQQNQLQCLSVTSNLGSLKRLSRPAVLRLIHPDGKEYFATIVSIGPHSAELRIANQTYRARLSAIEAVWLGESTLIWKSPNNFKTAINPKISGPNSRWLRKQLSGLNLTPEQQQGFLYIAPLHEQVKRFQISQGLTPDGIAGAQTLIMLNSTLNKDVPTLAPRINTTTSPKTRPSLTDTKPKQPSAPSQPLERTTPNTSAAAPIWEPSQAIPVNLPTILPTKES